MLVPQLTAGLVRQFCPALSAFRTADAQRLRQDRHQRLGQGRSLCRLWGGIAEAVGHPPTPEPRLLVIQRQHVGRRGGFLARLSMPESRWIVSKLPAHCTGPGFWPSPVRFVHGGYSASIWK